ncbi:chaperone protein dnaJ 11, chloroplastic-like [Cucumis melo]|uniref:Chaperone protein dnaJ 11, chloroplastic-like n=1 Tax=Cucumis melo TaxID=3656 RepID=A0A1S3C7B4_CUCME|nr:chaperone protein dnaJ 11, chloroplastic-like [Cucumis melo]
MTSSFFTSFTHSPLRPTPTSPSLHMPTSPLVASATGVRFARDLSVSRSSFYEVLGIPMTASCREIKAAYRKLARICHPDVVAENSAEEFIKIQTAYSTLSDPDKRADYDREICRAQLVSVSGLSSRTPVSGYSGYYTRRNWESDQCW